MTHLKALTLRSLVILTFAGSSLSQINVPVPSGAYTVALTSAKLTDEDRTDPYDPDGGKRDVMVSLFYPIERDDCITACTLPYMPSSTADLLSAEASNQYGLPNGTLQNIYMHYCCEVTADSTQDLNQWPLVLFSPGLAATRHMYNVLAQTLASAGYAVLTMDHTFDAQVVEFPDGTYKIGKDVAYWTDPDHPERLPDLLDVRVADARFILSELGRSDTVSNLLCGPNIKSVFNTSNAGFYGHSFGGATAIYTLTVDTHIRAAANMDGNQYGNLTDSERPALFFGRGDPWSHNRTNDPSWVDAWDRFTGWRRELGLQESQHLAFSDFPFLLKLGNLTVTDDVKSRIGTLDGQRSYDIITTYIQAFFDYAINGHEEDILDGSTDEFPEVVIAE